MTDIQVAQFTQDFSNAVEASLLCGVVLGIGVVFVGNALYDLLCYAVSKVREARHV